MNLSASLVVVLRESGFFVREHEFQDDDEGKKAVTAGGGRSTL